MNNKLPTYVLGILSLAFFAWAGVVWNIGQSLTKQQTSILVNQATLISQNAQLTHVITEHLKEPWHNDAGEALIRLQEQMVRRENQWQRQD